MSNRRYGPWSHARNLRNPLQFAGLVLWSLLISLRWLHAQFVQPAADWVLDTVLGAWEESVKAVIREAFGVVTHYTNYISGAILSVFSGSSYFQTVKRTTVGETKSWAWHSYWESATGTFNALLESEGLSGITLPSPLLRRASTPTPGTPRAHASAELVHQAAPAVRPQPAWHRRLADWWGRRRGSGETSAADAVGTQRAQQPGRPGSKAKAPGYQNGGARLGAAGQRKGLQQQAGISGQGRAEAAGRGASLARGSLLFELPSGFAISEGLQRLGLVEGARVAAEVGVTRAFSAVRRGLRRLFLLEGASSRRPADYVARLDPRQRQARGPGDSKEALARMPSGGSRSGRKPSWWRRLGRLAGASDGQQPVEDLNVWTASDIILRAGYPLEEHSVTTPDGYILQMHRIPRPGTRDVVFFQHGVLDTSLGWVANGSVGSQAFAAYDAGFDVWLANARSNAPRLHKDPHKRGSRYWHYSSNELGLMDIAAQIDHLHAVKCREILMQRRERAPWAAWRMPSPAVQAQAGGLREAANGGTEAAAGNRSSAAAAAAAAQQTRRSEGASGGTGDSPRRASQGNGSAADDCAAADGDGSRELPGAAEAATGGQPLGGLGSWGSGCAAAAGAGEGGGAARLGRSASAPLLQGGWQGWHASGMEVSPSQVDFGDAAGGQGLEGLDREGHVGRWGGGGLRATEQKIGAAAAAADAAGSSTGAGREPRSTAPLDSGGGGVFSALLGGASLQLGNPTSQHPSPPAAAAAQLGPGLAQWGSTDSHAGDGQPAPQPGMQHAAGAADGTAGLRRTQSAGAILSLRQVVGRSRGSKARRTRNCGAGPQAAPIMAALEPAEGRVVEGCGVEEHLLRPLKPIRTIGSPGTTPRSSKTNGRSYPSPSTPSSLPKGRSSTSCSDVHSCSDGSSDETEGDGYATPHSAGYDTPRSGYTTPGSEHSGSVRSGSVAGAEVDVTPYRLQVVGHSLGAASVLLYAVGRRMLGQPHRIRRIILMSPAGFHTHVPMALRPFKYLMPLFVRLLGAVRPGVGMGLRLPSPLLRFAVFKLTMDLDHIPALHELVRAGMRLMLSGDRSQWDRAMLMPHYNTFSMPALSLHCGAHFAQWSRDPSFRLFDYGSRAANRRQYGTDVPPSIADHYHLLGPVPVDLIAGRFDGIISCQDVQLHYERMKEAGVHVTYREYDFGHMDFTFAVKDEIRRYVLSRLQRPIL